MLLLDLLMYFVQNMHIAIVEKYYWLGLGDIKSDTDNTNDNQEDNTDIKLWNTIPF